MTYKDLNSIEGLLNAIDYEIDNYKRKLRIIYNEFGIKDGEENSLPSDKKNILHERVKFAYKVYQDESRKLLNFLDQKCKNARRMQPSLSLLDINSLNRTPKMPNKIVLGRIKVDYDNFHEKVSRTVSFPIKSAIFINDERYFLSLHKLFLRLIYALPIGKCTFRVFDPYYRGEAIQCFNSLMKEKEIFPDGGVLYSHQDMKKALEESLDYAQNMVQNLFTTDCPNWESYNRMRYSQGDYKRMLEYRVMAFFGLPYGLNAENFELFRALLNLAGKCGILVIFAYNQDEYEAALNRENGIDKIAVGMTEILGRSSDIRKVINDLAKPINSKHLKLEELEEDFPDRHKLDLLLHNYIEEVRKSSRKVGFDFKDIADKNAKFKSSAANGIIIPIGERYIDKNILNITIDDDTPHYIIGGTSGSGKSNLLHNLIVSACWRYSPRELELYLLDFKMGTEFNLYAHEELPHAKLISVSDNDVEYGVSVLKYLENEIKKRSLLFNQYPNCGDYKTYRRIACENLLPRMLVIVDEFQVLLSGKGAMERLLNLAKQGRSFGMHMVFATQTLRGLDFSAIGTQFRGRIALHCEESDSIQILGGASSNNNEAAFINKPYAILNIGSGTIKDNVKFSVPEAKKDIVLDIVKQLHSDAMSMGVNEKPRIYRGDSTIQVSHDKLIYDYQKTLSLTLGVENNILSSLFRITMPYEEDSNLMIVGKDKGIKQGLLKSIIYSGIYNQGIDVVAYAGQELKQFTIKDNCGTEIIIKNSIYELIKELQGRLEHNNILLIIDNCNLTKEFEYTIAYTGQITYKNKEKEACGTSFFNLLLEGNVNGSFCVAIYDTLNQLKRKGFNDFQRLGFLRSVCFGMSEADMLTVGSIRSKVGNGKIPSNRAVYIQEETLRWFKPFVGENDEQEN